MPSMHSDCHSPVFPNRSRFSNTVHTNLVSIQTAGKQSDKNILPTCTHFALLESPMQLEIMHGGKFSDRALLIRVDRAIDPMHPGRSTVTMMMATVMSSLVSFDTINRSIY